MKSHDYGKFAKAYSELGIEGTYYLAYRDLPSVLKRHVTGKKALDYGCGAGRSTRFLKSLGFEVSGVDISRDMIKEALLHDKDGTYYHIKSGFTPFKDSTFDVIFSTMVFVEIPSKDEMTKILREFKRVLKDSGTVVIVTKTKEGYNGNWVSFNCDFPENKKLNSGDRAKVHIKCSEIVLYDYFWTESDYKNAFSDSGFKVIESLKPMPKGNEGYDWLDELKHSRWVIYVLKKSE
jgi:ubiquinone/menaquinone biosynthesis C-methylase UbiE